MTDDRPSDEDYTSVVHLRIRKARLAKGLLQSDVAGALGIKVREYQRLERSSQSRRFNPTLLTLRALSKVLDLDIGDLVTEPTQAELNLAGQPDEPRLDRQDEADEQDEGNETEVEMSAAQKRPG
ncbi:hypothetical protein BH24DEI2_BH24DEI2_24900 [soil metagenome]